MPLAAVQCLDIGEDVVAGHFPQMAVADLVGTHNLAQLRDSHAWLTASWGA